MGSILKFIPNQNTQNLSPIVKIGNPVAQQVPIMKLPKEVLFLVFAILKKTDLVNCSEVCRHFYHFSNLPSVWQACFRHTFPRGLFPKEILNPKALFQEYDLMRKNVLNGFVTCHVLNAPEQITWVGLFDKGT